MVRAIDRLRAPPLRERDYEGFVDPARMAATNASLAAQPFGGVIVACPWLPDVRPAPTGDIVAYARYLLDVLLPRVRGDTPALASPEATGIDGVSLGGILALRIGLTCPESFGAVGGIQAALADGQNAGVDHPRAGRARAPPGDEASPPHQPRRLLSRRRSSVSPRPGERRASRTTSPTSPARTTTSSTAVPGSIELLIWHDRALARS